VVAYAAHKSTHAVNAAERRGPPWNIMALFHRGRASATPTA
jgi:hypothetical protein